MWVWTLSTVSLPYTATNLRSTSTDPYYGMDKAYPQGIPHFGRFWIDFGRRDLVLACAFVIFRIMFHFHKITAVEILPTLLKCD